MIQYSNPHEYQILQQYAASLGNTEIQRVVAANQAMTAADVRLLAQLYWYIVDTGVGEDLEFWLERLYSSLQIHCSNQGFADVWDAEIPE